MRLLFLVPFPERGGGEEYVLRMARAVRAAGDEASVAMPDSAGLVSLAADLEITGAKTLSWNAPNVRGHFVGAQLRRMQLTWNTLRAAKPDVVQITPYKVTTATIVACAIAGTPMIVRWGGVLPAGLRVSRKQSFAFKWAKRRRQAWIALSNLDRKKLADAFDLSPNDIHLVPNGCPAWVEVDLGPNERRGIRRQVREELGLPENSRILLTVARLVVGHKGQNHLIEVIPRLRAEFPTAHFVWVGDGEDRALLAKSIERAHLRGVVHLLGHRHREGVARLLAAADLFVFPTLGEGHSNALNEAMVMGVPIVASNAGAIPEYILDHEEAILHRAGDTEDLLRALQEALRYPEAMAAMAVRAKARVATWSEEQMFQATRRIWHQLTRV